MPQIWEDFEIVTCELIVINSHINVSPSRFSDSVYVLYKERREVRREKKKEVEEKESKDSLPLEIGKLELSHHV